MKTWKELLGNDTTNAIVDGKFISRKLGKNQYKIIWSFPTRKMAQEVLKIWKTNEPAKIV